MLFDTHAHLNDSRFDEDRHELIMSLSENGVGAYCEIGFDIDSSLKAIELANKYDFVYAVCGVHPHDVQKLCEKDMDTLSELLKSPKAVALGEIGLDYYYDNSERDKQRYWFDRQLKLAVEADMPVSIHTRDAMGDTIDILRANRDALGIIHCYSGSKETARELLNMGYYISFAGPLTFKNANAALEVAKYVPDDRILIETDSPYLAPVPYRGKRNTPVYVAEVAKKLAELRACDYDKICDLTYANAKRVYRID